MSQSYTLEDIVFETVHHNDKSLSVADLAAQTGTGKNHLYRMANINDECNMPLRLAVPIMIATGDFSILHFLAKQTGHLCIDMPRGIRKGTDPKMDVSTYSTEFNKMVNALMDFINDPTDSKAATIDDLMRKHIGDSENIRRRVKKHNMHQRELEL